MQLVVKTSSFTFEVDKNKNTLKLAQVEQLCQQNFYLDQQQSLICLKCPLGCNKCQKIEQNVICSDCETGYLLKDNLCVTCSSLIPSCNSCGSKQGVIYCLSCQRQFNGFQSIPTADLKSCISCQQIGMNSSNSNCVQCSLKNSEGIQINYLNQSKLLYSQSPQQDQSQEINQYTLFCDQCASRYFLDSQYQCSKCIDNCDFCYQGDLTEDISNPEGYYTLKYKYKKYQSNKFIKKCLKCQEGYFLQKSQSLQDEQCLPESQLTITQKIKNCILVVVYGNNSTCRFCFNSGQKLGTNACNLSLDNYNKDTKCVSFYQKDDGSLYCDLCLEGYTPSPQGCQPCRNGASYCTLVSLSTQNESLFSLLHIQVFKQAFTEYEEQNYMGVYQIKENFADLLCDNNSNPIDKKCQISECQQSRSCFKCNQNEFGKEYCELCRESDPTKNEFYDSTFKPSIISRKRVKIDNSIECASCDRYCNTCIPRTQEEIKQINPYFLSVSSSKQITEYHSAITQKCIQQRPLEEQCLLKSMQNQSQITQSIKCDQDINKLQVYYNSLFNRFTVCQEDQISCKKSMKFAKVIDCSINPQIIKLSDIYNNEKFMVDPYIYKISQVSLSDKSRKIDLDFQEYENIPYAMRVFNEELITNFEYIIYVIPNENKSCHIKNEFTIKSTIASKVFAIETISLELVPLINGEVKKDEILTFYMSENVNIEGFNSIKLNNLQIMDSQISDNQVSNTFGINLTNNLFQVEIELNNITFIKNQDAIPIPGYPDIVPQNKFSKVKKLIMNNIKFENWQFSNGISPFVFSDQSNNETSLIKFTAEIKKLQFINVVFREQVIFPIVYPNSKVTIKELTIQKVKFFSSTFSSDIKIPLNDLSASIMIHISDLKIIESLLDASTLFTYVNDKLNLNIETLAIDDTNKFKNGNGINIIQARRLNATNINLGCQECGENYLDFNWYRLFQISDITDGQKQGEDKGKLFQIQNLMINLSTFRQKSFILNIPFTPAKESHLVHIVNLKNIYLMSLSCKGVNCKDGLNAINISGVQEARVGNIQIQDSNGFQLLKVSSSKIMEISSISCSNENLELTLSSTCLIAKNYYMFAHISKITAYYLSTVSQEIQDYFNSQNEFKELIDKNFESQSNGSPILKMSDIILQEVTLHTKEEEGQIVGGLMIQNNVINRSIIQGLNITNAYVIKEETAVQELVAGLYYTSTEDIIVLDSARIDGIDGEYCKMVNHINANVIRIINGIFKNSNSQRYWTNVRGGFFNILTQDLLVQSTKFMFSQSYYGGALYISNTKKAVVKILGPNTQFYSNMAGQQGGAFYVDSSSSIDFHINKIEAVNLIALNNGGFFYMKSEGVVNLTIDYSTFKNCFCEQGGVLNIDTSLQHTEIHVLFDNNKFTSPKKFDTYAVFDNDTKQGAMFYLLRANLILSNNQFYSIYFNSPLVYLFSGTYEERNNSYKDIELNNPPFVFVQSTTVKINKQNDKSIQNTYEDFRMVCKKEENCKIIGIQKISFLYSIDSPFKPPQMHNMIFKDIKCNQCGLIFLNVQSEENKMTITNSLFLNNNLFYSPIQIISQQSKYLRILIYDQNQNNKTVNYLGVRKLQTQPLAAPGDDLKKYDLKLLNCSFIDNIVNGDNGGALHMQNINAELVDIKCTGNESKLQGGCIYYSSQNLNLKKKLILINTQIFNNIAEIGGGIRVIGTEAILKGGSEIKNNKVTKYGQDYLSYPMGIVVSHFKNGVKKEVGISYGKNVIDIDNWVTGLSDKTNGYFIIEFLDINQIKMSVPNASVEIDLDESEINNPSSKIEGVKQFSSNDKAQPVILNDVVFKKQPMENLKVQVKSSSVKYPIYDKNTELLLDYDTNFYLILNIKMRECLVGEAFFDISGECRMCDKDYYSLHKSSTQCLECPKKGVDSCDGGNKLNLMQGFWRQSDDSDNIVECSEYKSGCLGGYESGDKSCKKGYIGALCQSCDIYGKVWGESYSKSSLYTCKSCKEFSNNLIRLAALGMFVCLSLFLSIKSQIKSTKTFKYKYYLRKLGFLKPGKSILQESQVAIVIKIFTTYIQIIGHISKFEMKLPSGLDEVASIIGNPIRQVSHSLDCQIALTSQSIPIIYLRVIWKLAQPIFLLAVSIFIYSFFCMIVKKLPKKTALYTITLYTFIYMQPSIVQELIATMACSQISGMHFIKADYNYQCYNDTYYNWTFTLVLPSFIFWCIICPLILLLNLWNNKASLQYPLFKEKYGYLYNEYRVEVYFWELFKILMKIMIVGVIEFYSSSGIYIKGILMILICFVYGVLQKKNRPYHDINMNQLDKQSSNACLLSVILVIFYYKNPYIYFQYITLILLVGVNARFICKVLIILLREYTIKFSNKIDKYRQYFHRFFPRLSRALKIGSVTLARKQHLWDTLRLYVYRFVKNMKDLKQQSNEELLPNNKLLLFTIDTNKSSTPSTINRLKSYKSKTTLGENKQFSKISTFHNKGKSYHDPPEIEYLQTSSNEIPNENVIIQDTKSHRDIIKMNNLASAQQLTSQQKFLGDAVSPQPKDSNRNIFDFTKQSENE